MVDLTTAGEHCTFPEDATYSLGLQAEDNAINAIAFDQRVLKKEKNPSCVKGRKKMLLCKCDPSSQMYPRDVFWTININTATKIQCY
ncbi:hypothetical protein NPIL_14931 [Nephila pilipes]|uniref:Uncharacterized protein n=1 Tax=Nephila pilipes TaxID=299642 RepID=A0A8X6UJP3_NEPPI|nr:hypothetical protein NPIL_14931 [Nephila pilipes]